MTAVEKRRDGKFWERVLKRLRRAERSAAQRHFSGRGANAAADPAAAANAKRAKVHFILYILCILNGAVYTCLCIILCQDPGVVAKRPWSLALWSGLRLLLIGRSICISSYLAWDLEVQVTHTSERSEKSLRSGGGGGRRGGAGGCRAAAPRVRTTAQPAHLPGRLQVRYLTEKSQDACGIIVPGSI